MVDVDVPLTRELKMLGYLVCSHAYAGMVQQGEAGSSALCGFAKK